MKAQNIRARLTACLAIFAFVLAVAPVANAQTTFDAKSQAWWDKVETQVTESLDSPVVQIREQALQHVIFFASNYSENVDFTNASIKALEMYESGSNDAERTLALMAIHASSNDYTMKRLSELVQWESSQRIQQLTMAVLADYYGQTT